MSITHVGDTLPNWRILLIGGSSATGKTVLARRLAIRLGVSCLLVDDLRLAIQRMTTAEAHPALHLFFDPATDPPRPTEDVWARPPETLSEGLIEVARVMSEAIEIVMDHHIHITAAGPIVLEGDGILPELAARRISAGDPVRAVFLVEQDEQAILANARGRGRGMEGWSEHAQQAQARMSWLYGQRLRHNAEVLGLPVVTSQPWETLEERAVRALKL